MNTSASITKMTVRIRKRPESVFATPTPVRLYDQRRRCTIRTTRLTNRLSNNLGAT